MIIPFRYFSYVDLVSVKLLYQRFLGSITTFSRCISELMASLKIEHIDYLKINAEGAELNILKRLSCWEKVSKVAIAAHHYAEEAEEIQNFLRRVGFKTLIVHLKNNTLVYAKR